MTDISGYIILRDNWRKYLPTILAGLYKSSSVKEASRLTSKSIGRTIESKIIPNFFVHVNGEVPDGADQLENPSYYLGGQNKYDLAKLEKEMGRPGKVIKENITEDEKTLSRIDEILRKNQKSTIIDISNILDISPRVATELVDRGRSQGYKWGKISDGVIYFADSDTAPMGHARIIQIKPVAKKLIFGVMSDTHYGSKVCMKDEIEDFVDTVYATGARTIFHCGDAIDNNCVYSTQTSEIELFGVDQQIDLMIEHLPKKPGLTYYLVLGNHDLKSQRKYGFNISRELTEARKDIVYLGDVRATVKIPDEKGIDVMLRHSGKGSQAYAMSYPLQRLIQNLPGGSKPNVFIGGHVHYGIYLPQYRNVHALYAGCFQGETTLTMEKEIPVSVGGWICRVSLDESNWSKEFSPTWVGYYLGIRGSATSKKSMGIHKCKKIPGWSDE